MDYNYNFQVAKDDDGELVLSIVLSKELVLLEMFLNAEFLDAEETVIDALNAVFTENKPEAVVEGELLKLTITEGNTNFTYIPKGEGDEFEGTTLDVDTDLFVEILTIWSETIEDFNDGTLEINEDEL